MLAGAAEESPRRTITPRPFQNPNSIAGGSQSKACCDRIIVKATGKARDDQSLYLGTYRRLGSQLGRHTFIREGEDKLYVYFFSSQVS